MDILKSLNISKFSAAWTLLTGGWAGLAKLICEAFTKLLKKADPDKLRDYSELAAKIAGFIRTGIDLFVKDERIRAAANATAAAIEALANHIKDGQYDEAELDSDVDNIEACIEAWKQVASCPHQVIRALLMTAAACGCAVALSGCAAYYENVGVRVRAGEITAPIEVSEPTSSANVRFLFFLDGVDLYAAKGSDVSMTYNAVSSGTWLTSATTQSVSVVVRPATLRAVAPSASCASVRSSSEIVGAFGTWLTTPDDKAAAAKCSDANCSDGKCDPGTCAPGTCTDCSRAEGISLM